MQEYRKIFFNFWIGDMGKKIRSLSKDARIVAMYLITNKHSSMSGVYYLPIAYIGHDTGLTFEEVSKGLFDLCHIGFCSYDEALEYVWVHNMAFYQVGKGFDAKDNRVKSIQEAYVQMPNLPFLKAYFDKYQQDFYLGNPREYQPPFEAPGTPLLSHIHNHEHEHKQEQEHKDNIVAQARPEVGSSEVIQIFEHWKSVMGHPNAQLDDKRRSLIRNGLRAGYSGEQLRQAISGCAATPHNMGDNDRGQRYDGLHVILRSADQIDRFIGNFHQPPRPMNAADKLTQTNLRNLQQWVNESQDDDEEAQHATH